MARPPSITGGAGTRTSLKNNIPLIAHDLNDAMLDGVKQAAERIVEDAKARVPVGESAPHLRDAIHVETEENVGATMAGLYHIEQMVRVVAGNSDLWYGHIIEHGSAQGPGPRPFLIPAFEKEKANIEQLIGEQMRNLGKLG